MRTELLKPSVHQMLELSCLGPASSCELSAKQKQKHLQTRSMIHCPYVHVQYVAHMFVATFARALPF